MDHSWRQTIQSLSLNSGSRDSVRVETLESSVSDAAQLTVGLVHFIASPFSVCLRKCLKHPYCTLLCERSMLLPGRKQNQQGDGREVGPRGERRRQEGEDVQA